MRLRLTGLIAAVLALSGCPDDDDDSTVDDEPAVVRLQGQHRLGDVGVLMPGSGAGRAGWSLAVADFDGDGFDDLAAGAPGLADAAGGVLLWRGSADGPVRATTWTGVAPGDQAGFAVAAVGDVSGDGLPDLLVGAPGAGERDDGPEDTATLLGQGAAYVLDAPLAGDGSLGDARATLAGERDTDCAGYAVAGLDDVTGDGVPDLAVGAPCRGSYREFHEHVQAFMLFDGAGAAYVVDGSSTGGVDLASARLRVDGVEPWDRFGRSVADAGDHDGDGVRDLAVGAPDYYGAIWINPDAQAQVFVFDATRVGTHAAADGSLATLTGGCCGAEVHDELGSALVAIDGGLAVGAPGLDDFDVQGGAFVLEAPLAGDADPWAEGSVVVGPTQPNLSARAGTGLAAGFDLDCDGVDDVALGAPAEQELGPRSGAARVGYGPLGAYTELGLDGLHALGAGSEEAGAALAAGDLDGDGCDELVVGAPAHRVDGAEAGAAWWIRPPRQ